MKNLNKYLTYKMALDILNPDPELSSAARLMRVRRVLRDNPEIETIQIGRMVLVNREQFCKAIDVDCSTSEVRWPVHIAILEVDDLITIQEAAEILGIADRNVYKLTSNFLVTSYQLSHWGGQQVVLKSSAEREKRHREYMKKMRVLKNTPRSKHA